MAKLNDARRSLERARESALERLRQIEEERCEIKSSVKSLNAALKALKATKSSSGRKNSEGVTNEQAEGGGTTPVVPKSCNVSPGFFSEEEGGDDVRTSE